MKLSEINGVNDIDRLLNYNNLDISRIKKYQLRNAVLQDEHIKMDDYNKRFVLYKRIYTSGGEYLVDRVDYLFRDFIDRGSYDSKKIFFEKKMSGINNIVDNFYSDIERISVSTESYNKYYNGRKNEFAAYDVNFALYSYYLNKINIIMSVDYNMDRVKKFMVTKDVFSKIVSESKILSYCVDWYAVKAYCNDDDGKFAYVKENIASVIDKSLLITERIAEYCDMAISDLKKQH